MNSLDEHHYTSFQIGPAISPDYIYDRPVIYCHQGFNLDNIVHISEVLCEDRGIYKMYVTLDTGAYQKELMFKYDARGVAVRSQRELWRAYTKTGEFAYVREDKTTEEKAEFRAKGVADSEDSPV